jgi:hypothetical protein
MKNNQLIRTLFIITVIAFAVISRFLPHPPNFTPIVAVALFGGAMISNRLLGFALPLIAMFISDIFIGFHNTMWAVYLSFALISLVGFALTNRQKFSTILGGSILSSIIFFVITNFAVWMSSGGYYPKNVGGLIECYVAAIPFFNNGILGDLFYTTVLFGSFYLAQKKIPALSEVKVNTKK